MRAIIYGPGAIGGTVGGHLALAGYKVALIGRGAHIGAIREHGLRLVTPGGTHTLPLPAVANPAEIDYRPDDILFLCVKGQDSESALRALPPAARQMPVFCLQNGVRNEEIAARYSDRVYGAMLQVGGVYLTPGEVIARRDPPGMLVIGRYPAGADELAEAVAASLRAARFAVLVTPDVMPCKWGKLISNLGNAVDAITGAGEGDCDAAAIVHAAQEEARALLARASIRWISRRDLLQAHPELDPPERSIVAVEAGCSTWQSLARGQGTLETDYLNGEIVRLAARLGAEAPVNAGLNRIALEMAARREQPGRYSAAELRALLGPA